MREAPTVRPDDSLEEPVAMLAAGDDEGVPVIDASGRLVGWLTPSARVGCLPASGPGARSLDRAGSARSCARSQLLRA
jgi:hypothetical protein